MTQHRTLATVVGAYRIERRMSLRQFSSELNESLVNTGISYETVRRWEGPDGGYEPSIEFLFECIATYDDWRALFAADCLRAMYPDLIGTKIQIHPLALPVRN